MESMECLDRTGDLAISDSPDSAEVTDSRATEQHLPNIPLGRGKPTTTITTNPEDPTIIPSISLQGKVFLLVSFTAELV